MASDIPSNGTEAGLPPVPPPGPPPGPHPRGATGARIGPPHPSRFQERMMHGYSPAQSLYEEELDNDEVYQDNDLYEVYPWRPHARKAGHALNAVLHMAACSVLLAIMAVFLQYAHRRHKFFHHSEPGAIVLVVLLVADLGLDALTLVLFCRHRQPSTGTIVGRLVLGVGYIALFMVYVGIGAVFPRHYTFWGLRRSLAGPAVYLFLWVLGVWDLTHTMIHRHQLGTCQWLCWRRAGRQQQRQAASPPALQRAVPLQAHPGRPRPPPIVPGMGLPPPVGSTPTTAAPPQQPLSTVREAGEGMAREERRDADKPQSSSASTQVTPVEQHTDSKT